MVNYKSFIIILSQHGDAAFRWEIKNSDGTQVARSTAYYPAEGLACQYAKQWIDCLKWAVVKREAS